MTKEDFEIIRDLIKLEIKLAIAEAAQGDQAWSIENDINYLKDTKCD